MIIDSLAGIPLPGIIDIKPEKKAGVDTLRPIVATGDSTDPELNIKRDNEAKHQAAQEKPEEEATVEAYNAKGKPISNNSQHDEASLKYLSISLEI